MLPNKLLLITSERIGDLIFCTPAIDLLHRMKPDAQIDALALSKPSAGILAHNPAINQVFTTPTKKETKELAKHYDAVIDLHTSKLTEQYVKWLNKPTYSSPRAGSVHQSDIATQFIQSLLPANDLQPSPTYLLYPQDHHEEEAKQLLEEQQALEGEKILIGCHMGCHKVALRALQFWKRKISSHKTWPFDYFKRLFDAIYRLNPHIHIVLTGTPSEEKLVKRYLADTPNIINLIGKTSPLTLACLMKSFRVFLTADTGPLHIACTTPVPIVTLFAPTSPDMTGPKPNKPSTIVIKKPTMAEITVDETLVALKPFLSDLN